MEIYGVVTDKTMDEVAKEFEVKGYGDFKLAVGESVADMLAPFHERCAELEKDKTFINECIKENAEKASYFANKTLRKVHKKLGLTERIR
jgi:tryptophanyl-tRNA synthetase